MTQTPNSSTTSYLTPTEFVYRYDQNLVCQYLSDSGAPIDPSTLSTNTNLLELLADASAMLESAAMVGNRYSVSDLQAITAEVSGTCVYVGGRLVKRLVADLAMGLLRQRRGMRDDQPFPPYLEALRQLDALRDGEMIFAFTESAEAGTIEISQMSFDDLYNQNRLTAVWPRYWGVRPENQT